jgi:thiol-disulfide isomerase/thioredoxin
MRFILLFIFFCTIPFISSAQPDYAPRCNNSSIQKSDIYAARDAADFTITTTDGITRNLYNTLDSGKTVFVDLFYTTCYYCQLYAPIIEEIYQNTGAGAGNIVFWAISNNLFDPDSVIDQYKLNYNITNPCAGPNGGGITAFSVIVNGQNFQGFPTYCVICPDRTLFFDPCYPPTPTCFDPYFVTCSETIGMAENETDIMETVLFTAYPNPAREKLNLEITSKYPGPVTIGLYNLQGTNVSTFSVEINPDSKIINIPVDHLPAGTYFLRMVQNNEMIDSRKVLVLNK